MSSTKNSTPRSTSRSKRSTTNLANLRLAPLSAKFSEDSPDTASVDGGPDAFRTFAASHRSAPTSPRITSRRGYLGGLSRRNSLYDGDGGDGVEHSFDGESAIEDEIRPAGQGLQIPGQPVPKAKSEAALSIPPHQRHPRLSGPGVQLKRKHYNAYASPPTHSGTSTPRVRVSDTDDWLTRTGQAASSILQEQKGQAFLSSRNSQVALGLQTQDLTSDEDEDEGYEELAAMSAHTTRSGFAADDELSPVSTRASRWGSRYGSRRGSRRGSTVGFSGSVGVRTPMASAQAQVPGNDVVALPIAPDFIDADDSSADEEAAASTFTSLGGLVDKLIGTSFFHADEARETTESESEGGGGDVETETEAKRRIAAENARRNGEKERLRAAQQRRFGNGAEGQGGGWEDARWLFGRAREAWS